MVEVATLKTRTRLLKLSPTKRRSLAMSKLISVAPLSPLWVVAAVFEVKLLCPRTYEAFSSLAMVEVATLKTRTRLFKYRRQKDARSRDQRPSRSVDPFRS